MKNTFFCKDTKHHLIIMFSFFNVLYVENVLSEIWRHEWNNFQRIFVFHTYDMTMEQYDWWVEFSLVPKSKSTIDNTSGVGK